MSWVTIIWSMIASACLTLAAMHLLVWYKKRTAWAYLLFALTSLATAGVAFCELKVMRAESVGEYGNALRWGHLPFWVLIISLLGFVRLYMKAGRLWLAWTVCGLRTLSLILNFVFNPNLNYREINDLRHFRFLGDTVSVAKGIPNPWMLVGQTSLLLLMIFLVDVTLTIWRRGERRSLLILSITMVFFIGMGTGQFVLGFWGFSSSPLTPSLFFLGVVAAMAYGMSDDVHRAAQLSDDLCEQEERLDLAADSAGVGLWSWDFRTNQIWATERARQLYGFSSDEPIPFEKLLSRLHPDDREWVTQASQQSFQEGAEFRNDYRIVLPDGSIRWFKVLARAILTPSGKPERMTGVSLDITERTRTEEALRESEARYRGIFNGALEGMYRTSLRGKILVANPAAAKMLGYDSVEEVLSSIEDTALQLWADLEERSRFVRLMEQQEYIRRFECQFKRKDGTKIWVSLSSQAVRGLDGEVAYCDGFIEDITERKLAEAEALRQHNELAHVTRVTTMGQLASSLAHELNQPLGAILRNAEAAEMFLQAPSPDLEEVRAILADIRRDDQRAGQVIDRMRTLLRRRKLEYTLLDIGELVDEITSMVHSDAVSRGVKLEVEVPGNLPPVRGDRVHLQQVLLNLLLNGMEAMGEVTPGDRRLLARARQSDAGTIEVSVADAGHGIPAAIFDHLFEPFFTTKPKGLGMGLPISSTIIIAHGGRMWAESSPAGATFYFTLPAEGDGRGAKEGIIR
jgi:two-component system, LuxR family, sensor kinase FixL